MPRSPEPLPGELGVTFTSAQARDAGVSRTRLRAKDLRRPTRGVRSLSSANDDFLAKARAFATILPAPFAYSHLTAARVQRLPVPSQWNPDEPLDVMRRRGTAWLSREGVVSHRGLERRETEMVSGLLVTDPIDTWADLGSLLAEDDLLAVADTLLSRGQARPKDLHRIAADRTTPGARALRRVAPLARPDSASPWESKARHAFLSWGLPEPQLNVDLRDADGTWIARPDFLWQRQRVVGEYDGDQHRTNRSTWQYERERRAGLEDAGYTYVEMTSSSLVNARHREALRRRLVRLLLP